MSQSAFLERSRYYLAEEYPAKIRKAVEALEEEAIWQRTDEASNSIGNLLLHLSGNIRQWIVSGVGGVPGKRDRAAEFAARDGPARADLLALLDSAVSDADAVLASLNDTELDREVTIQGRDTTVFAAIYHVVEHFSMHTGQIILLAKMHAPGSVNFYEDAGGLAVPVWAGNEKLKSGTRGQRDD
jgi:uncharacterized damage-inducible protein DinB